MWMLVFIAVIEGNPMAVNAMGPRVTFDNIQDCFYKREQLAITVGGEQLGYYPPGRQALCVYLGEEGSKGN